MQYDEIEGKSIPGHITIKHAWLLPTEVPISIKEYKATEEREALQRAEHERGGV